jgi:hypothetical protein
MTKQEFEHAKETIKDALNLAECYICYIKGYDKSLHLEADGGAEVIIQQAQDLIKKHTR